MDEVRGLFARYVLVIAKAAYHRGCKPIRPKKLKRKKVQRSFNMTGFRDCRRMKFSL